MTTPETRAEPAMPTSGWQAFRAAARSIHAPAQGVRLNTPADKEEAADAQRHN